MTAVLDFEAHLPPDTGSVERARETPVVVERLGQWGPYLVAFEDSDHVHEVELTRDGNRWHGDCWAVDEDGRRFQRCRGVVYSDGPCAHLWAVRSGLAGHYSRRCRWHRPPRRPQTLGGRRR